MLASSFKEAMSQPYHTNGMGLASSYSGPYLGAYAFGALGDPAPSLSSEQVKELVSSGVGPALGAQDNLRAGKPYILYYEVEGSGTALQNSIREVRSGLAAKGVTVLGHDYRATYHPSTATTTAEFWYVVTPPAGQQGIAPLVIIGAVVLVSYVVQYYAAKSLGMKRSFVAEALVDLGSGVGDAVGEAASGGGAGLGSGLKSLAVPILLVLGGVGLFIYFNRGTVETVAKTVRPGA